MVNVSLFWPGGESWVRGEWRRYGRTYEKVAEYLAKSPRVGKVVCVFPPAVGSLRPLKAPTALQRVEGHLWLARENRLYSSGKLASLRRTYNGTISAIYLRAALHALGFASDNTVLWLFPPHPYLDVLVNQIPHRLVVTHVVDDYRIFPGPLAAFAPEQYARVPGFSDMVIAPSESALAMLGGAPRHQFLFSNGVDEEFLSSPAPLPYRLTHRPPRLGFVGWITDRTDLDLLSYVGEARPDWSLIIAGPDDQGSLRSSRLLTLPNVTYLGAVPYRQLPALFREFDVCLIPYKPALTRMGGVIKFYQYLASGRPIVSTAIDGLDKFGELVRIADSEEQFLAAIVEVLESDTMERSTLRIRRAQECLWPTRVDEMLDAVLALL